MRAKKGMHTWFPKQKEERQSEHTPCKHLPMLWSVFEESKEAKVKSGVDTWDRLALEPQGDKPQPTANQTPQLFIFMSPFYLC
jgi:hypothetical protein